jgi:hypothetical protein
MAEETGTQAEETSAVKTDVEERDRRPRFDTDKPLFRQGRYVEDENFVPSPYDQYGTVRTAGTAGDSVHGDVNEVSPAFQIGRAQTLIHAARALDPEDPTPMDHVVLPNANYPSEDQARERVFQAAQRHLDDPVELGMTDAQREAALGTSATSADGEDDEAAVGPDEKTAEEGNPSWQGQSETV